MVRIENLSKRFGQRQALHPLSLKIETGEIFGLLGHNGAGKSTTFGMMLGHVHPDAGEVFIAGHSVQQDRARALSRVGAIFETPSFYDYMSGWQNLRFFVSLTGPVPDSRLREIVRLVGLEKRIQDPVRAYSHGMRQRLALAQALLPDPTFILLDEPTEGLDPEGIHEMRDMVNRLRDQHGLTVLLASHLLVEVEQLCDRIAILHQGRLVFCGRWQQEQNLWELDLDDWAKAQSVWPQFSIPAPTPPGLTLPSDVDMADVVAALVGAGVRVRSVERVHRTLEDFYLEHIGA